jgi:hypothetical protein
VAREVANMFAVLHVVEGYDSGISRSCESCRAR